MSAVPALINTSLNTKGMPICETWEDSILTFLETDIDLLVVDDYLVEKPIA